MRRLTTAIRWVSVLLSTAMLLGSCEDHELGEAFIENRSNQTITVRFVGGDPVEDESVVATVEPGAIQRENLASPRRCIDGPMWVIRDADLNDVAYRNMRIEPLCHGDVWVYDPATAPPLSEVYIDNRYDVNISMRVRDDDGEVDQDRSFWMPPNERRRVPHGPTQPGECLDEGALGASVRGPGAVRRDLTEEPLCYGDVWIIEPLDTP